MTRPRNYLVERPEQLETLASPVRVELLTAVESLGPCGAAELSAATGRAQSSLYFHLEQLVEVGLLLREERDGAAVFQTPGRRMRLAYEPSDPERLALLVRSTATILRSAERALRRAFESGLARVKGKGADTMLTSRKAWLRSEEIAAVAEHLAAIEKIYDEAGRAREGRLHTFTAVMSPLPAKEQKRS